jgi:hypothetical protein
LDLRLSHQSCVTKGLRLLNGDGVDFGKAVPAFRQLCGILGVELRLPQGRRGAGHRDLVVGWIDDQQEIPLVDVLVVGNAKLHNAPKDLRRHGHNIRPHGAVACPGRIHVSDLSAGRRD